MGHGIKTSFWNNTIAYMDFIYSSCGSVTLWWRHFAAAWMVATQVIDADTIILHFNHLPKKTEKMISQNYPSSVSLVMSCWDLASMYFTDMHHWNSANNASFLVPVVISYKECRLSRTKHRHITCVQNILALSSIAWMVDKIDVTWWHPTGQLICLPCRGVNC